MINNPVPWPNGARCAVAITFDMDADSLVHIAHPDRAPDMVSTTSMLRYGPQVGVPRILETYRRLEIKQTFFIPAWCAETYPGAIEQMVAAGHEVALHSYIHEMSYDKPREEELYWLQRSTEVLERISGARPRGWRAPMYSFSKHSAELLVDEGFLYDASLMGDDVPYLLSTPKGSLVELPAHWGSDDYPQYAHTPDLDYAVPVKAPREAIDNYNDEFEAHYAHGGLWIGVWHPFLTGRLTRWHHIEKMLMEWRSRGDVWFATLEEIANHVLNCERAGTYKPRVDQVPFYDARVPLHQAKVRPA
ncbi:polysaccharide deacetylase family protein [Microvirga aerophila]|uniref:Chitooligosaccharide deacetylase n=2 Tax=Microvirga aerophila TaxID=670291 RepID=A0A512BSZ7_9HYPH|nr:polysaccharide deacetylase [Microvirga aerophila]GEO15098.1 polysaccharide deacetylase [Microvirga aerophila]